MIQAWHDSVNPLQYLYGSLMSRKLHFVELTDEERAELEELVSVSNHSAQKLTRARILLKSDKGWSDPKITDTLDGGTSDLHII